MKAGKIWGQTELIHANGVLEFHRIEFKKNILNGFNSMILLKQLLMDLVVWEKY